MTSSGDTMAEEVGAVRDHLANERTQLAWIRTGANVMIVGLAVARFADNGALTAASLFAGGLLLLTGAITVGYGTFRYRRVAAQLRVGTASAATSSAGPTVAAIVMVTATIASAVILLIAA